MLSAEVEMPQAALDLIAYALLLGYRGRTLRAVLRNDLDGQAYRFTPASDGSPGSVLRVTRGGNA
jgi:hypothetical protein